MVTGLSFPEIYRKLHSELKQGCRRHNVCSQMAQVNPLPDDKYSSKLKEYADDNIKFDENGRKFLK